jgi:uncharacterized repeat protein (TIGR03803 family)
MIFAFLSVAVLAAVAAASARAQTYTVLYSFAGGADGGGGVDSGLVRDNAGNLYGTTWGGGAHSLGVVFKLDTTGKETVLYSFAGGSDGANPHAGLIHDSAGNLYGTTVYGGVNACTSGCGIVFKVDSTGKETRLYEFLGTSDGSAPFSSLARDSAGNLYGTTSGGGASGFGVVFKLDTAGKLTVLHSFTGGSGDGKNPFAGLIRDSAGNLYGTTQNGGVSNYGTVFKLDATNTETVLYSFSGGVDGGYPYYGHLIRDKAGNLYGTTYAGGTFNFGTVFKLDTTGKETVLHSFAGGLSDGQFPFAGLVRDSAGNLYGSTYFGGAFSTGTLFKVDKTGVETVLRSLSYSSDGGYPYAGLILDTSGNLYGTTSAGGPASAGVVFRLFP